MEAYLQGPNGEEIELKVVEPDPADGSFVVSLDQTFEETDGTVDLGTYWIRIVPNKGPGGMRLLYPGQPS